MDDETVKMLKFLRLPGLHAHWDEYLDLAQKQDFSHVRLLKYILEQECKTKTNNTCYRTSRNVFFWTCADPKSYQLPPFPG